MSQGQEAEGLKMGPHPNGESGFLRRNMLYLTGAMATHLRVYKTLIYRMEINSAVCD